jgi:hypothetical protein
MRITAVFQNVREKARSKEEYLSKASILHKRNGNAFLL